MCGRYYIDEETAEQLSELVKEIDRSIEDRRKYGHMKAGDYCPSMTAVIVKTGDSELRLVDADWGFRGFSGKPVINARSESVEEKKMFSLAFSEGRCVIPASGFYEWNQEKQKYTFTLEKEAADEKKRLMYLAGLCKEDERGIHFVILTMAANQYMRSIHDRMPVIMNAAEALCFLTEKERGRTLMRGMQGKALNAYTENEQLSFF